MRRALHWVWDAFLESLVAAIAMGIVEMIVWTLQRSWKRRKKRKKEQDDGQAEPD